MNKNTDTIEGVVFYIMFFSKFELPARRLAVMLMHKRHRSNSEALYLLLFEVVNTHNNFLKVLCVVVLVFPKTLGRGLARAQECCGKPNKDKHQTNVTRFRELQA